MIEIRRFVVVALLLAANAAGEEPGRARPAAKTVADWTRQLAEPDRNRRLEAVQALGAMGPAGQAAAPALYALSREPGPRLRGEPDPRDYVAGALWQMAAEPDRIGPELAQALAERVADNYSDTLHSRNDWEIVALRAAPAEVRGPALRAAMKAMRGDRRMRLINAAARWGAAGQGALPGILEELGDGDASIREWAAERAGLIGPAAAEAVPRLRALAEAAGPSFEAARALARMGRGDLALPAYSRLMAGRGANELDFALAELGAPAMPVLIAALRDRDQARIAASALAMRGGEAAPAVPALTAAIKSALADDEISLMMALAETLGEIGLEARPAVPLVAKLLDHAHPSVPRAAVIALGKIGGPEAVKALIKAMAADVTGRWSPDGGGSDFENTPAGALARLGPAAAPAIPTLLGLLPADRTLAAAARRFTALGAGVGLLPALSKREKPTNEEKRRTRDVLECLSQIGAAALPAMIQLAGNADPKIRGHALEHLGAMAADADDDQAEPAIRVLIATLGDEACGEAAAEGLAHLGPRAAPAVPGLLKLGGWSNGATKAIAAIGPAAAPAVRELVRRLADSDEWVRANAAEALAGPGPAAAAAVPALCRVMDDPGTYVRMFARSALGAVGPAAKEALPKLAAYIEKPEPRGQPQEMYPTFDIPAAEAYLRIDPEGPAAGKALAVLAESLVRRTFDIGGDPESDPRAAAAALERLGPAARPVLADILRALPQMHRRYYPDGDPVRPPQINVIRLLARFGPAARDAVPVLRRFVEHNEREVRAVAAVAFWRITGEREPSAAVLAEVFSRWDYRAALTESLDAVIYHRRTAVEGMAEMGGTAFVPLLLEALRDHDAELRRRAAEALGRLGTDAAPAVPELARRLEDPDHAVRRESARALARMGPAAAPALPALLTALRDPDRRLSRAAAGAVAQVGWHAQVRPK